MKLFFEKGPRTGQSVELTPPFIALGREVDNDVVLEDENASRYHARISHENAMWAVEDLGSSNGTYLNGKKLVDREPLSINDIIRIGGTQMRFGEEAHAGAAVDADGAAVPNAGVAGRRRSHILALLGVFLMVVIAVVVGNMILIGADKANTSHQAAAALAQEVDPQNIRIYFERIEATDDKLARYRVEVKDGTLVFEEDNLSTRQFRRKEVALSEAQRAQLHSMFFTNDFLSMESPTPLPSGNSLRRTTLAVTNGRRGNVVEVVNATIPPPGFGLLSTKLVDFVSEATGMLIIDDPDEVLRIADEKYTEARQLDMARTVKPENLYYAIKAYDQVLLLLDGMADPPDFRKEAAKYREQANASLMEQLTEYKNRGNLQLSAGNYLEARNQFQKIMELIPDQTNEHNATAREYMAYAQRKMDQTR